MPVRYVWLDDEDDPFSLDLTGTWYDSRRGKGHRGPEYRLYYPAAAEPVVHRSRQGDSLFLCQPREGPLLAIFCPQGSTVEQQLLWLFGLQLTEDFEIFQKDYRSSAGRDVDLVARQILELIGIEVIVTYDQWLDRLLAKFGEDFPPTREFSAFARKHAEGLDALKDPDATLLGWMEFEERLFMTLERHIVSKRLEQGFAHKNGAADVDAFVKFSLSVQNRRKSRAGWALGNHIDAILKAHKLPFKREATTEKRNGPDFLFPGEQEYQDAGFPSDRLLMLGAKTTCKDRWRQVLAEADRIKPKHLLTLEAGISPVQTDEMQRSGLSLVVPAPIHDSYQQSQLQSIYNFAEFLERARSRCSQAT